MAPIHCGNPWASENFSTSFTISFSQVGNDKYFGAKWTDIPFETLRTIFNGVDLPIPNELAALSDLPSSAKWYNVQATCFSKEVGSRNCVVFF